MANIAMSQNEVVVRIDGADHADYKYFTKEKDDITSFKNGEYIDIMVNPQRLVELEKLGWEMKITQTPQQNKLNLVSSDKSIAGYRSYDEVLSDLEELVLNYPTLCSLSDIGNSQGKEYYNNGIDGYINYQHDIWMLKISDNVGESEDEPAVYFMGAHHAREPISTEVVMGIVNYLMNNYGIDEDITNMVDNTEIYIVPMVNPDGHEVVLDQLNTNWRKNISDGDGNGILNYNNGSLDGVDPNRNYGWEWGGQGSSDDKTAETYRGPEAFSESEIITMKDLLSSHHFVAGISYHSYSELVLYPYAYSDNCLAPDHAALSELATNMALSIPRIIGSGHYTPEQSNDLYPASGTTDDWAYGKHGIFGYTIELAQEFIPPAPQVPAITSDNIDAAMMLLNRVNHSTLRGHVYDATTLEPLVANVRINAIDNQGNYREPYKSDADFGSYYRLLTPGTFDVDFTAYGYVSQTVTNVDILATEATYLDIYLEQATIGTVSGSVLDGSTGENIEGAEIVFLYTPLEHVFTNSEGVYTIDSVSNSSYTIRVSKEGYATVYLEKMVTDNDQVFNFVLLPSVVITFEEGVFDDQFTMAGQQPWVIDYNTAYEGDNSAVSGDINDNQSSIMILNAENRAAGVIKFYAKVSSESDYDFLTFSVDNAEVNRWSGEVNWEQVEIQIPEGDHEFKWVYIKDGSVSSGSDHAWVDYIELPPILTTTVNVGQDLTINQNQIVTLHAFADNYETLNWTSSGDGSYNLTDILTPDYTPGPIDISNGQVELKLSATGIETATDELILTITNITKVDEVLDNSINISPNPAHNYVYLILNESPIGNLEIYSISGIKVQEQRLHKNQSQYEINTSHLNPGVYLIKISTIEGAVNIKKLLVE